VSKIAIIIGAGPAGLTAAYELLDKTEIKPIIFEMSDAIGGLSRTVRFKGNRMDIGGHRFFTKSDRVINFWTNILPIQGAAAKDDLITKRKVKFPQESFQRKLGERHSEIIKSPDPENVDQVLLIRRRTSRVLFGRKFYDYPVKLSFRTLRNLGLLRSIRIFISYIKILVTPFKTENNLEEFFINRFGRELYITFFKDYTQKVWGVPCNCINAEWGIQRIKGLSILKAFTHALRSMYKKITIRSKKIETSLVEEFYYPKLGPGQMWEELARTIISNGGEIHKNSKLIGINIEGYSVKSLEIEDTKSGEKKVIHDFDFLFSSMPVKDLIFAIDKMTPTNVREVAESLVYRDFITVGLLLTDFKIKNRSKTKSMNDIIPDNWIYIQDKDVKLGRIQIFNNWSPYMVEDINTVFIGLEYFCNEGDELWSKADQEFIDFAIDELIRINMIDKDSIVDSIIIRVPKAYPAYFGSYSRFDEIREYIDKVKNLFLIGRNGMHRYNNSDHSILTAMRAVDNIISGLETKQNIWEVNTEEEYHESKNI